MSEYPANKKNLKERGDYGIRVAKDGYDAYNCLDSQLLFNSNWPIIQIAKMQNIKGTPNLIGSTAYPTTSASAPWELTEQYDKSIAGVDRRYVYTKAHIRHYSYQEAAPQPWEPPTVHDFYQCDLYGFTHALGYAPMFFSEEDFNGYDANHNRVILTNIDIAKDVDYPYVDKPSIGKAYSSDYGIKSKAYYAGQFPSTGSMRGVGLDTAIQSKQIQAVKTQDTMATSGWPTDESGFVETASCVYYPPKDSSGEYFIEPDQFEYYGFTSSILSMLRSPDSFTAGGGMGQIGSGLTNVFSQLDIGYGAIYFRATVFPLPFDDFGTRMTGVRLMPADWFERVESGNWVKQSLIAVRIPMVSPDVVNVEV